MALPEVVLDDRTFQDLVNEARERITRSCPEWTEHNVSDPGVTLIELFAWMTEMLSYRINRVPDKLHVALLELLGIRLDPPTCATTELRFRLAAPAREAVEIAAGDTEIGTLRTAAEESVVFETTEGFTIPALELRQYVVGRTGDHRSVKVGGGHARPTGTDRGAFGRPPEVGDAVHLGFTDSLARLVVRLQVECSQARGAGVDPEDPPLRWEVSGPEGTWLPAEVLQDSTGGFNYGSGTVELQLPDRSTIVALAGHRCHWLRCRLHDRTRDDQPAALFSQPPEIYDVSATAIGALVPAAHSTAVIDEPLGESDGTPGQSFGLRHAPVLALSPGERLEVRGPGEETWKPWEPRESFVSSGPYDRHFTLDLAAGEVSLGPAIREADGRWSQHGVIPPKGAALRMSGYRRGGGRRGNVAADALHVLRTPVPGIATVTNPRPARGGVDAEPLDAARHRAALEIRTRYRAVTAEDFEFLSGEASPRVGRVVCRPAPEGSAVNVHIVPRVDRPDRRLELDELLPDDELLAQVAGYLDERRTIGATVRLLPAAFRGISVVVSLEASMLADPQRVEQDAAHALYTYVNPVVGGSPDGPSTGWRFGHALNVGELFGIMGQVDGVEQVKVLRVYETDMATGEQSAKAAGNQIPIEPTELIASGTHIVKATHGTPTA